MPPTYLKPKKEADDESNVDYGDDNVDLITMAVMMLVRIMTTMTVAN